jgi:hypothetical protein
MDLAEMEEALPNAAIPGLRQAIRLVRCLCATRGTAVKERAIIRSEVGSGYTAPRGCGMTGRGR